MAIIARFGDIVGRRSDVMQGVKARGVVEGGLLAASLATIALLSMYIPYVNLLWPLPIALVSARHGVRYGVMTAVAGALVVGLLVHMMTGLFLFLRAVWSVSRSASVFVAGCRQGGRFRCRLFSRWHRMF